MFVESKVLSGGKVYFYKDIFTGSFHQIQLCMSTSLKYSVLIFYAQSWQFCVNDKK